MAADPALTLWTNRDTYLRCLVDPRVLFRILYMAKMQMKVSEIFRTWAEAERFARLRGLVETAGQQWDILEALRLGSVPP